MVPIEFKIHYFLHVIFLWNEECNLDSIIIDKNKSESMPENKDLGAVLFDVCEFTKIRSR